MTLGILTVVTMPKSPKQVDDNNRD